VALYASLVLAIPQHCRRRRKTERGTHEAQHILSFLLGCNALYAPKDGGRGPCVIPIVFVSGDAAALLREACDG